MRATWRWSAGPAPAYRQFNISIEGYYFFTIEWGNARELEKTAGKQRQLGNRMTYADLVILDELGYLPFSQAGGALLFYLISKLYEYTNLVITINFSFAEGGRVLGDAKMTRHCWTD